MEDTERSNSNSQHKRETSTNVHLLNDCCIGGRTKEWRKNQKVAEGGRNGGGKLTLRTNLGASLDPELLSLRILLTFMIGVGYI